MVLSVTTVGCPERPLAMMPSLPAPLIWVLVTLNLTQVPTVVVDEQFAGLKKLPMIPFRPTFWIVLESFTENGVSRLWMPSLLALAMGVLATVNLKLVGPGASMAGMGPRPIDTS